MLYHQTGRQNRSSAAQFGMTGCLPLLLVLFASPACGLWTVPIREADVIKVGDDFGAALHSWSCEVLRSGTNSRCSLPGLTDVYASLMTGKLCCAAASVCRPSFPVAS